MAKRTVVDWENLPKDEPVEVKGADIFLGYFDGMESDWGVRVRSKKDSPAYYAYNKYSVLPLNKEHITVEEDWSSVKVDARVRCRDLGSSDWIKAHFAKFEREQVWVYPLGTTSWTKPSTHTKTFDITELIDE